MKKLIVLLIFMFSLSGLAKDTLITATSDQNKLVVTQDYFIVERDIRIPDEIFYPLLRNPGMEIYFDTIKISQPMAFPYKEKVSSEIALGGIHAQDGDTSVFKYVEKKLPDVKIQTWFIPLSILVFFLYSLILMFFYRNNNYSKINLSFSGWTIAIFSVIELVLFLIYPNFFLGGPLYFINMFFIFIFYLLAGLFILLIWGLSLKRNTLMNRLSFYLGLHVLPISATSGLYAEEEVVTFTVLGALIIWVLIILIMKKVLLTLKR